MQSNDFIEGVSGWRMARGRIEMYGGPVPIILGSLGEPEPEQPKPYIVVDGVTYINEDSVEGRVAAQSCATAQLVNAVLKDGRVVVAGINLGRSECQESLADAIKGWHGRIGSALEAGGVNAALDRMAAAIRETKLYEPLLADSEQFKASFADDVKDVIRSELRQGGLLWRRG